MDNASAPTTEERYRYFRENAEIFVKNLAVMIADVEAKGNEEQAAQLRAWALMPWEAAIRDDDSGDLWPVCEGCGKPIKDDSDIVAYGDATMHSTCAS